MRFNRREFHYQLVRCGAALVLGASLGFSEEACSEELENVGDFLSSKEKLIDIGKRFLKRRPELSETGASYKKFIYRLPKQSYTAAAPFLSDLQTAVQSDFDSGRTVQLRGWILSETEALLCALLASTAESAAF